MRNTLETKLGVFFALTLIVAVIILEMVGVADFFKPGYRVYADFKTVQELKKGDLVKMAGVEIGRVDSISLTNEKVRVAMKIKKRDAELKTDSMAKLDTVAGEIGGLTKSFTPDNLAPLFGPITDFMKNNSTNLSAILDNTRSITEQVQNGRGSVGKLLYDDTLYNTALSAVVGL